MSVIIRKEELEVQGSEVTQHTCGRKSWVRTRRSNLYWEFILCRIPRAVHMLSHFIPQNNPTRETSSAFILQMRKLGRENLRNLPKFDPWQSAVEARRLVTLQPPVSWLDPLITTQGSSIIRGVILIHWTVLIYLTQSLPLKKEYLVIWYRTGLSDQSKHKIIK